MTRLAERFGQEVRARRKARGLTQVQLSETTQLSEEWIRRIERGVGAPSFEAIEALAGALGVSVADLFAPMSARDGREARIGAILADLDDAELDWIEGIMRAAIRHPAR